MIMDLEEVVYKLTAEVAALTATVRENNIFLKDFIEAQRHCNQLVEEKIRQIELHGSKPAEEALRQVELLGSRISTLEVCSSNQRAVVSWWDHAWVKIGLIIGILLGVAGFIMDILKR
jgi:hypothetical protein